MSAAEINGAPPGRGFLVGLRSDRLGWRSTNNETLNARVGLISTPTRKRVMARAAALLGRHGDAAVLIGHPTHEMRRRTKVTGTDVSSIAYQSKGDRSPGLRVGVLLQGGRGGVHDQSVGDDIRIDIPRCGERLPRTAYALRQVGWRMKAPTDGPCAGICCRERGNCMRWLQIGTDSIKRLSCVIDDHGRRTGFAPKPTTTPMAECHLADEHEGACCD